MDGAGLHELSEEQRSEMGGVGLQELSEEQRSEIDGSRVNELPGNGRTAELRGHGVERRV